MTTADIRQTVADYARVARNAMEAGFDGLEILAAYLYLIPQFLNRTTNRRTDEYGGSIENRARILFETVEAAFKEVDPSRVGVKIGPMHDGGPKSTGQPSMRRDHAAIPTIRLSAGRRPSELDQRANAHPSDQ
jgi:N-ethylmaleimide reductase